MSVSRRDASAYRTLVIERIDRTGRKALQSARRRPDGQDEQLPRAFAAAELP
jgi:hypothetical protein